jgi:hypothetical protein
MGKILMNFNKIYIISWFGEGEQVEKRMKFHDNQLNWCFENDIQPVVFAQNYKPEYYRDNVEYIKYTGQVLRFGEARNELLKLFYNSDDDFAIFADNDAYLYKGEKYGANDTFVQTMRDTDVSKFKHVDCFYPINPAFVPFSKDLIKHKLTDSYSWRFKPGYIAAQMFVLKNLKKHHNKEIYYDDNFVLADRSILPCEDQDFPINLIHNNMTCFVCSNLIKKDEGHNSISTWSPEDKDSWRKRCLAGLDYIAQKYNLPKQIDLEPTSFWMKVLKKRNHKLTDTYVFYKETMFDQLFEIQE